MVPFMLVFFIITFLISSTREGTLKPRNEKDIETWKGSDKGANKAH